MEKSLPEINQQGLNVASISYDSVSAHHAFAKKYDITFPLLSDKGSMVIRKFGILNTNIPKDHPFYGIPFPGTYLISPNDVVQAKFFLPRYQNRVTASEVMLKEYGVASGEMIELKTGKVKANVRLSSDHAAGGQQLGVLATFDVAPGWHIYGKPLPGNYAPTTIKFASPIISNQSFNFPKATPVEFKVLKQTLPAYSGKFQAKGKIMLDQTAKAGDYELKGTIHFQACNNQMCKLPQDVAFALPLKVDPLLWPPPPPKKQTAQK